jgi:hypothetical protein
MTNGVGSVFIGHSDFVIRHFLELAHLQACPAAPVALGDSLLSWYTKRHGRDPTEATPTE